VQPRLLILCHGGNDFLQKRDDGGVASNVRAMIRSQGEEHSVVLLATPKPGRAAIGAPLYAEIAAGREGRLRG